MKRLMLVAIILIGCAGDPVLDQTVRGKTGAEWLAALDDADVAMRNAVAGQLAKAGAAAVPVVVKGLEAESAYVRAGSAITASELLFAGVTTAELAPALPGLAAALKDDAAWAPASMAICIMDEATARSALGALNVRWTKLPADSTERDRIGSCIDRIKG